MFSDNLYFYSKFETKANEIYMCRQNRLQAFSMLNSSTAESKKQKRFKLENPPF